MGSALARSVVKNRPAAPGLAIFGASIKLPWFTARPPFTRAFSPQLPRNSNSRLAAHPNVQVQRLQKRRWEISKPKSSPKRISEQIKRELVAIPFFISPTHERRLFIIRSRVARKGMKNAPATA